MCNTFQNYRYEVLIVTGLTCLDHFAFELRTKVVTINYETANVMKFVDYSMHKILNPRYINKIAIWRISAEVAAIPMNIRWFRG
jgi:hypothetical protein